MVDRMSPKAVAKSFMGCWVQGLLQAGRTPASMSASNSSMRFKKTLEELAMFRREMGFHLKFLASFEKHPDDTLRLGFIASLMSGAVVFREV